MRKVLLVSLMVLLVASFAFAQDEACFRGRIGWVDAGDLDSDLGFGVDYMKANSMFSFDYSSHDKGWTEMVEGVAVDVNLDADLMSLSYTFLQRPEDENGAMSNSYYGAGIGYYDADADLTASAGGRTESESASESSVGFHLIGGMEFGEP
ncbi:MAG: hypothetical protein ACLFWB_03650, partial [Armatimonadota bacterium]